MIKSILIHSFGGALLTFLLFKFAEFQLVAAVLIGFGAALLTLIGSLKVKKSLKN